MTKDSSTLALVVTYVIILANSMSFFMMIISELAKNMSSIQRIEEYIKWEEQEKPLMLNKTPKIWPTSGHISVNNVHYRYREGLELVIKNLSFEAKPGEKVAILGRTGSGKSTFLLGMMRILEMAEEGGIIELDGVDISQIGLHELRKNIAIIPQDPFLLQGTLRFNVDPESQYSDDEVIEALNMVRFFDTFKEEDVIAQNKANSNKEEGNKQQKPSQDQQNGPFNSRNESKITLREKILYNIESKGANLSIGQRQLICIARVLIEKPKVLLMDEATANIDHQIDSTIQSVIKNFLKESTVLTIAHRIITIIQYDKLIIMDNGEKIEEGTPLELIYKEGLFNMLVEEGGPDFKSRMIAYATDHSIDPSN